PKKAALGQHRAIGQQCRGMEIPPVIQAAGEGPCPGSRIVNFRACAISVIPTRNQYLAIVQQGSRMTIRPLSVGAASEGPRSCRRIVEFRGGATATPGDQHLAAVEQGRRVRTADHSKTTRVTPCSRSWIIEFFAGENAAATCNKHLAIPEQRGC